MMSATATNPSDTPSTPSVATEVQDVAAPAASDRASQERMSRLRQLVRVEGKSPEDAAAEVGVDPIIAQLWLRLPDDLWTGVRPAPAAPARGLRRVITCRVPSPAYDRLRSGESSLLEAAANALETGLALPRPEPAPGGWRFARRPLAVPVSGDAFEAIQQLAAEAFNGDTREAAGWLIARGMGMALPLPTADELSGVFQDRPAAATLRQSVQTPPQARFVLPPRRRPETRAPLPPDDSAPNGDELRQRREEVGISQRDLAAASGLSRGLVAEIERGRRRHVLTRLRLAETLASLARSK
jgi:DNA-binding XRE family transcriptional regulator